ncbi:DUF4838 domain-containing protein [Parapedobacter indicus]|uniref:DUF4838 domain-containing protein n=1 Tax=Parapedobacter indicus TaxID=1477437 RepID=A0A1I3TSI0_9SPHI|nr:DUF4838 domain-containing protein [Parapedobacter indicus]PPK99405.1 uncharacterized protein DUF4838 [Parapedobacter indicus]SFJ74214.1 protein of unknown function [Parapedobacter indicus]
MKYYVNRIRLLLTSFVPVLLILGTLNSCSTQAEKKEASPFKTRGLVLDVNDLSTVDWPRRAKEAGLTTLATHITPSQVAEFIQSERGQQFLEECKTYGIEVEHELHSMGDLLPRSLFEEDSTMFRMNAEGKRVADYNLCVHSEKAVKTVCDNAVKYAKILAPTTGRYFYWIDDAVPMCRCPECDPYSDSEQALLLENAIVKALREEVDPEAMLAHLAYVNTLEPPVKVKPADGIFLEFAPIYRRWDKPLLDTGATGWNATQTITHGEHLRLLDENLKVFPVETAQVLEYWLDVSLFSGWKKPAVALPWHNQVFLEDIDVYAKRGIQHITSFGVYIDGQYIKDHPDLTFLDEYGKGLAHYRLSQ